MAAALLTKGRLAVALHVAKPPRHRYTQRHRARFSRPGPAPPAPHQPPANPAAVTGSDEHPAGHHALPDVAAAPQDEVLPRGQAVARVIAEHGDGHDDVRVARHPVLDRIDQGAVQPGGMGLVVLGPDHCPAGRPVQDPSAGRLLPAERASWLASAQMSGPARPGRTPLHRAGRWRQ